MIFIICRDCFSEKSESVLMMCLVPDVSLPQHKYPAAVIDAVSVVEWVTGNTAETAALGLDGSQVVLGGDSAGGGLSCATVLQLLKSRSPAFKHVVGVVSRPSVTSVS